MNASAGVGNSEMKPYNRRSASSKEVVSANDDNNYQLEPTSNSKVAFKNKNKNLLG